MDLGLKVFEDFIKAAVLVLLVAGLIFFIGTKTGNVQGRLHQQPTIDRLRADSTRLTAAIATIQAQKIVAEGYVNRYDAEIQVLTLERKADREKTDSTLYRIAGMAPADAKRAIVTYYLNRQNGGTR